MRKSLLSFCLIALLPFSQPATLANASFTICEFYTQEADKLGCAEDNYLRRFGYPYCRRFVEVEPSFSPEGQKVFSEIRPCLVKKLSAHKGLSCANVKEVAEASHVECYIEHGFCGLGWGDRFVVLWEVWTELLDSDFRKTLRKIETGCDAKASPAH